MKKKELKKVLSNQWHSINERGISMADIPAKRILLRLEDGRRIMFNDLEKTFPPALVTHWMEIPKVSKSLNK